MEHNWDFEKQTDKTWSYHKSQWEVLDVSKRQERCALRGPMTLTLISSSYWMNHAYFAPAELMFHRLQEKPGLDLKQRRENESEAAGLNISNLQHAMQV